MSLDRNRQAWIGRSVGDYTVSAHVADGAMGAVYEARTNASGARVALKILHPEVAEDAVSVKRFEREYETAESFDHQHIVSVMDFGPTKDGSFYLAMEFLEGKELGEVLREEGKMAPARALRIMAQVADALAYAHSFGVIHRDLKPDNIFLCDGEDGEEVRILDFGSVKLQLDIGPKLTAFGTTLGSPFYMSPEQAKGLHDVDTRTDVFAMAAILYEMLCGEVAFDGKAVAEILMKIVRKSAKPPTDINPNLPDAIDAVLASGLAKAKSDRTETPTKLVDEALAAFGAEGGSQYWAHAPLEALADAMANKGDDSSELSFVAPIEVQSKEVALDPTDEDDATMADGHGNKSAVDAAGGEAYASSSKAGAAMIASEQVSPSNDVPMASEEANAARTTPLPELKRPGISLWMVLVGCGLLLGVGGYLLFGR